MNIYAQPNSFNMQGNSMAAQSHAQPNRQQNNAFIPNQGVNGNSKPQYARGSHLLHADRA
jgi:hypothetical protein